MVGWLVGWLVFNTLFNREDQIKTKQGGFVFVFFCGGDDLFKKMKLNERRGRNPAIGDASMEWCSFRSFKIYEVLYLTKADCHS